ncbi:alpha/beta fold hydrolase [Amycolatopsis sp. FDAARGOS 1241]|uniref:alpha/beta fold hydrolase n=1 Tax=Amycolatopsis sp. FDAARGOS 1241 TaxID=2778070 RepID=UPI0019503B79|nr:alpha/beta hydrolase [Amycolatopsis sp. FDAARGOS 1241]QRP46454.1 alpha/beta hydrolase [Amycolatopsis sp. FDAARGOS 1241]
MLVAHSAGGPVAQFAADRLAEKVKRVVFADAFVLRDGECVNDLAPRENVAEGEAAKNADGTIPVHPETWSELFTYGAATAAPLVPIPARWVTDRVALPRFWKVELPSSYVFFTDDRSAPRAAFEALTARLGDPRRVECAGPHEALLTHPEGVAEALLVASKD